MSIFSFQVRAAFRQARLDHQPLRDRSQVHHRLLRRWRSQPGLPVHHPGRPACLGLSVGRVGQDEGGVVALDLVTPLLRRWRDTGYFFPEQYIKLFSPKPNRSRGVMGTSAGS